VYTNFIMIDVFILYTETVRCLLIVTFPLYVVLLIQIYLLICQRAIKQQLGNTRV